MEDDFNQLTDENGRPLRAQPVFSKPPPVEEDGVDVPYEQVPPESLTELIKAFILREGTDYGAQEARLDTKVEQILNQLKRKEVKIVFDLASETFSIVSAKRR